VSDCHKSGALSGSASFISKMMTFDSRPDDQYDWLVSTEGSGRNCSLIFAT
jgi:hypothetical protein